MQTARNVLYTLVTGVSGTSRAVFFVKDRTVRTLFSIEIDVSKGYESNLNRESDR
jgi:hypothetical protein